MLNCSLNTIRLKFFPFSLKDKAKTWLQNLRSGSIRVWDEMQQQFLSIIVISHIGSERPEPGPYKCMLTLISKTRFGVMRGCQEQTREGGPGWKPWKWVDWEA
jgi:hypothetical protein